LVALARAHALKVDRRDRAPQTFRIVAAVELLLHHVLERHLLWTHEVSQPHLVRLEPRRARDRIHDGFDRQAHAGAGDAAIRQDRHLLVATAAERQR
jgi:hypothetical protein